MKNSEVNEPLKEINKEEKEKEIRNQEAPGKEQKSEIADQIEDKKKTKKKK